MRNATITAAILALPAFATPAWADLANGQRILQQTCAACHGYPPVAGPERAAGQPSIIRDAINFRVPSMFFLRGTLSDSDIDDIAAFLLTLQTPTPPPSLPDSYQGLWLKFPFASESGWGINFTHAGSTLFA